MTDFSKFNKTLTPQEEASMFKVRNSIIGGGNQSKQNYPEPVSGTYIAQIDRLGIIPYKKTGVPCFDLRMNLIQGMDAETEKFLSNWPGRGNPKIFRTLPLVGTKNDGACIGSAVGMASKLHETIRIDYKNDFDILAADIENLRRKIDDTYAYLIAYDPSDFNRIMILEILRNNVDEPEAVPAETELEQQVSEPDAIPQFDDNGYIPMDAPAQEMQKPTSYPHPNSDFISDSEMDELTDFLDNAELPF